MCSIRTCQLYPLLDAVFWIELQGIIDIFKSNIHQCSQSKRVTVLFFTWNLSVLDLRNLGFLELDTDLLGEALRFRLAFGVVANYVVCY